MQPLYELNSLCTLQESGSEHWQHVGMSLPELNKLVTVNGAVAVLVCFLEQCLHVLVAAPCIVPQAVG